MQVVGTGTHLNISIVDFAMCENNQNRLITTNWLSVNETQKN